MTRYTLIAAAVLLLAGCATDTLVAPEESNSSSPGVAVAKQSDAQAASGSFTVTNAVPVSIEPDDRSCVIKLKATFNFEGSLEGAFTDVFFIEHDGPCDQPAPEKFEVRGTYEGAVAGVEGSYPFEFEGTIDASGNAEGKLEMESGGVEAKLQLSGTAAVAGTYTGIIKVDD